MKPQSFTITFEINEEEFELRSLQEKEADKGIDLLGAIFSKEYSVYVALNLTYDEVRLEMEAQVRKSLNDGLACCICLKKTNEMIGIVAPNDMFEPFDRQAEAAARSKSYKRKMEPFIAYTRQFFENSGPLAPYFKEKPKYPYQRILTGPGGGLRKYQNNGLLEICSMLFLNAHPLTRKTTEIVSVIGSYASFKNSVKHGAKCLLQLPFKDFIVEGIKVFPDMDELQIKKGLIKTPGIVYSLLEIPLQAVPSL
jgi:hypothetical protein